MTQIPSDILSALRLEAKIFSEDCTIKSLNTLLKEARDRRNRLRVQLKRLALRPTGKKEGV